MTVLPMPPVPEYATLPTVGRYYHYIWDTMDIPTVQEREGMTIYTPAFDGLKVWGRVVGSPFAEDHEGLKRLVDKGRVWGQWFSEVVPEGEIGSMALEDVEEISAKEFSDAYKRRWT